MMSRKMLRSKIHRARVTDSNLDYEGSITIDSDLMSRAGIVEFESVQIVNINNGARFETYVIAGPAGSGCIGLNGAAARLVQLGDRIIIMSYGMVKEKKLPDWKPTIVLLDENNTVKEVLC
jgi:aspartate 1-decarboxylase